MELAAAHAPTIAKKPRWIEIVAPIVGALVIIGAVAKAVWDAVH